MLKNKRVALRMRDHGAKDSEGMGQGLPGEVAWKPILRDDYSWVRGQCPRRREGTCRKGLEKKAFSTH